MHKDITGNKYGRLTAIKRVGTDKFRNDIWEFQCDCGKVIERAKSNIVSGKTSSCGCLIRERNIEYFTKHGCSNSRLYKVWGAMRERCESPRNCSFQNYGARGITVCDEWAKNFGSFQTWALQNGYDNNAKRGECTIERLDVNGNYEPDNCAIVNMKTQNRNRRNNHFISFQGEKRSVAEVAEISGVDYQVLLQRINKLGWDIKKATTI